MITQYIRDEKRVPIGVMVGYESGAIGVSFCNPKDKFVKKIGRSIAENRAISLEAIQIIPAPRNTEHIMGQIEHFLFRMGKMLNN